jgi:hypothetical protein
MQKIQSSGVIAKAEYLATLRLPGKLYPDRPRLHQLRVAMRHVGPVSQSGEPVHEWLYVWLVLRRTVSRPRLTNPRKRSGKATGWLPK